MQLKRPIVIDIAYNNATSKYNPDHFTGKDDEIPPDWSVPIVPMPDAVICKASEALFEDPTFASNWKQLGEKGIPRGAYHFFRYTKASADQAKFFVETVHKAGGWKAGDVLVLDDEEEGHLSASAMLDFVWNVERMTGIRPLIYSRTLLLNALNLSKLSNTQRDYFRSISLWIAGTFNDENKVDEYDAPPSMFIPDQSRFGKVVLWQYGLDINPAGLMSGLPGGLDFNWVDPNFFAEWKTKTGGPVVNPDPSEEGESMIKIKPRAGATRLRTNHNTSAPVVDSYGPSDIVSGEEIWTAPADGTEVRKGDQWLHVTQVNGMAKDGWMAITHKGVPISDIVSQTPPVTEEYILHVKDGVQRKFFPE